ncbi:hypothetical protein B0181_07940 [Moraxella caviae]|uniref:DotD/TraH family lipoprotein n=1 Tax=Moraxella caviae TaxID=34060 RepID=A0A1S9ZYZ4_9GAMM|nr:DotD/TraH family lipoprotein [Moraxella caviae]OOR88638.1 hypothetical protein B0181_07940 [Moraxella caviae]STZ13678.1 Uncharacterised protein [Moraxella caviae]
MQKRFLPFVIGAGAVALTGCATTTHHINQANVQSYSPVEIIAQESQKAATAMQVLTKYRQAQSRTLDMRQASFENDKVYVDYIGKPRQLLASVAIKYGYRFIEVGNVRDLDTVNFTKVHGTPEDILINLNAKLGDTASIAINKQDKTITLIY